MLLLLATVPASADFCWRCAGGMTDINDPSSAWVNCVIEDKGGKDCDLRVSGNTTTCTTPGTCPGQAVMCEWWEPNCQLGRNNVKPLKWELASVVIRTPPDVLVASR
ncbi:MAG TPA: hypothetical protein VF618_13545 [Thermoanaerobaculia bacterium]